MQRWLRTNEPEESTLEQKQLTDLELPEEKLGEEHQRVSEERSQLETKQQETATIREQLNKKEHDKETPVHKQLIKVQKEVLKSQRRPQTMQSKLRLMSHQNTKGRGQASLRRGEQSRVKSAALGGESNSKSRGGSVRQERRPPVPSAHGARRKEAWAQRQQSVTPSPRTPTKVQGQMQKNDTDKTTSQENLRLEKQQITELQTEMIAKEKENKTAERPIV